MDPTSENRSDSVSSVRTGGLSSSRRLDQRSLAVDYIENRLQDTWEELKDPPTTFDTSLGRYVPLKMIPPAAKTSSALPVGPQEGNRPQVIRPLQPALHGMTFWAGIFPSAMKEFQSQRPNEPKGRAESNYGIRSLANWEEVYELLQGARDAYENPKGFRGGLKRGFRKVADNSQLLEGATKLVPDFDYASPVRGALELIANMAHRSMQVREAVSRSLDELGNSLGDIEAYLATFPGDGNIISASIILVASILKAIEDQIVPKTISALFNGQEYQKSLSGALEQIKITSQTLLHQARKSDMWQNRKALESTQDSKSQLPPFPPVTLIGLTFFTRDTIRIEQVRQGVVDGQQLAADSQNMIKTLFEELERNLLNEKGQRYEIERLKQRNAHLDAQVNYYRARTLSSATPHPYEKGISPDEILVLLKIPEHLEESDTSRITEKKGLVPSNDRARAELVLQTRKFREWVVSTALRELLVHGDFPGTHYTSGLSVLSCYLLQALGGSDRWAKLAFFCGSHLEGDAYAGGRIRHEPAVRPCRPRLGREWRRSGTVRALRLASPSHARGLSGGALRHRRRHQDYERDEYLGDMAVVLTYLLDLTLDPSLPCVFKLLITSPSPTTVVRQAIDPGFILSMASIRQTARVANEARAARETEEMVKGLPG
ncbi:hypothetical protein PG994_002832 [Apiospora phragmitis]|uniref:Uncharacterized protein n=1 Tax=Apiospora phragmitis TaxID=2905665 RepID=A0ABR1W950_9PEZI